MWAWGVQDARNCNARLPDQQGPDGADLQLQPRRAADLLAEEPIEFDLREAGTLQLFRTEKQLKGSKADQEVLAEFDSPFEVLDRDGCIAAEPGSPMSRRSSWAGCA
jgi:D-amino-acid dehydrogenase